MEKVIEYLKNPLTLYIGGAVVALLFIMIFVRMLRTKSLRNAFATYNYDYNSLKTVPLLFKLNKATALAKVSQEIREMAEVAKTDYDTVADNLRKLIEIISESEDYLELGKTGKVRKRIDDIEDLLALTKVQVTQLDERLDEILEQESQLRLRINKLKDLYQDIKHAINADVDRYAYCIEVVDEHMTLIEAEFTNFENAILASKFSDATEIINDISTRVANLNAIINQSPLVIEKAKNELPQMLDAVRNQYIAAMEAGVCFSGLPIETTLDTIVEAIKNTASDIRSGKVNEIVEQFNKYSSQLQNLTVAINKEIQAFQEVKALNEAINTRLDLQQKKVAENFHLSEDLRLRYKVSSNNSDLKQQENQLNINRSQLNSIMSELNNQKTLTSNLLLRLVELQTAIENSILALDSYYKGLKEITKDEDAAKENLLKLNLLVNQTMAAVNRHYLPSISETYHYDLKKAQEKIANVEALLSEEKLQVAQLKATIDDANDFVRAFFNEVNNVVGTCKLAEKTIVFCNKYRATFSDIDSDLTKAEMAFHNGEYSVALSLSLPIAQRMFPTNYLDLIKEYSI